MPDFSPPPAAREFLVQQAWPPAAAMPAALKTLANCRRVPIYLVECGFIQHVTCSEECMGYHHRDLSCFRTS